MRVVILKTFCIEVIRNGSCNKKDQVAKDQHILVSRPFAENRLTEKEKRIKQDEYNDDRPKCSECGFHSANIKFLPDAGDDS